MTTEIARFMKRLEGIWDDHLAALLTAHDPQAALAEAVDEPVTWNLPARVGAQGRADVLRFYAEDVIGHIPADLTRRRISRTVDRFHIADETTVAFTHDRELPWLLPGVAATGREVQVLAITVVGFDRGRLASQRTLWDLATMSRQLGVDAGELSAAGAR